MTAGARIFLVCGFFALLALAGCGRSMLVQGDRAAWRSQAEAQCMQTSSIKLGSGIIKADPIEGPGVCGADFPLKVAALGESSARYSYSEVPRPPGRVGGASQMPDWPSSQARYAPPSYQSNVQPAQPPPGTQMRWMTGPPAIDAPDVTSPQTYQPPLDTAPRQVQPAYGGQPTHHQPQYNQPTYNQPRAPAGAPMSIYPPGVAPPDDIPDDAILPDGRSPAQPAYRPQPQASYTPPPLGPARDTRFGPMNGPQTTAGIMPVAVKPAATLSCPIVSALDRWVSQGVQPAALHWFGVPVTEIRQISAYSCRQMNGAGGRGISEHAFGNALDISGFTLADGRKIVIKNAWRNGTPEEQGFLHDVQLYACETFNTVLAPGYNAAHYDHFHFDLMRRKSGKRPCRPEAIKGEVVAAKARAIYAAKRGGTAYTGSIGGKSEKRPTTILEAIAGADGLSEEDEDEITGSIASNADDVEFENEAPPPKSRGWPVIVPQHGKSPADY